MSLKWPTQPSDHQASPDKQERGKIKLGGQSGGQGSMTRHKQAVTVIQTNTCGSDLDCRPSILKALAYTWICETLDLFSAVLSKVELCFPVAGALTWEADLASVHAVIMNLNLVIFFVCACLLAESCAGWACGCTRSPKSKRHPIFAKSQAISLALLATLLFPSKYSFTLLEGTYYRLCPTGSVCL